MDERQREKPRIHSWCIFCKEHKKTLSITYHLGQVSYNEMLTEQIYLDVMHYSEIQALLWPNFGKNTVTPRNTECQSMTFDLSSQCDRQSDKPMSIDSPISPSLSFGSRYEKNGKKISMAVTVSARGSSARWSYKVSLARRTEVPEVRDWKWKAMCIMLFKYINEKFLILFLWRPPSTWKT